MSVNANLYMHEQDRAALAALKAIPAFTPLLRAYMKAWNEKLYRIQNMATNLRISEQQLPQYYALLPPICAKLGIEVPELYLKLDVSPNSYTSGDTKPFIVVTSGLLETLPEELLPTVLAHECGHIACHHVLYSTMGQMILSGMRNGAAGLFGLGDLLTLPVMAAFAHWMRCSEFSADRAAALCDGTADKMVDVCMRFAGYDKDIGGGQGNVEAFLDQAKEYRTMVAGDKWNKVLELYTYWNISHPLNAVRAIECREWQNTEQFGRLQQFIAAGGESIRELPMPKGAKAYIGQERTTVELQLRGIGFDDISCMRVTEKAGKAKPGQVLGVSIAGQADFKERDWFAADAEITIIYYDPLTAEEIKAAHPGEVTVPDAAKRYLGRGYQQVLQELSDAGFTNLVTEAQKDLKRGWLNRADSIARITIGGQAQFEKGDWFKSDASVRLTYHTFADTGDTPAENPASTGATK